MKDLLSRNLSFAILEAKNADLAAKACLESEPEVDDLTRDLIARGIEILERARNRIIASALGPPDPKALEPVPPGPPKPQTEPRAKPKKAAKPEPAPPPQKPGTEKGEATPASA